MREAEKLEEEGRSMLAAEAASAKRKDMRGVPTMTIDPFDAKDFDDAICLHRISKDRVKVWVHIADVSHYVKPGSALDAEARKRGLLDRNLDLEHASYFVSRSRRADFTVVGG